MDPILQAQLVMFLLEQAGNCAPWSGPEVKKLAATLSALDLEDANWVTPMGDRLGPSRRRAARVLEDLGTLTGLIHRIDAQTKALDDCLTVHEPAGIILGDPREVRMRTAATVDGDLYVITEDGSVSGAFERVGEVTSGKVTIVGGAVQKCPRGTLVYLKKRGTGKAGP